jgi:hypothetical protein
MKKEIKNKLPQIKKTINSFLVGEEGKISKESIIKAGIILTAVSLGTLKGVLGDHTSHGSSTPHNNGLGTGVTYQYGHADTSTHGHHANHGSHESHAEHSSAEEPASEASSAASTSHGSHGSCCSGGLCNNDY